MKHRIELTEILQRTILVEADSVEKAIEKVGLLYADCNIVLSAADYVETCIGVVHE